MQLAIFANKLVCTVLTDRSTKPSFLKYDIRVRFPMPHVSNNRFLKINICSCKFMHDFDWSKNPFCRKLIYLYVLWWCMSKVIDLKKYYWYSCKFMQLASFCKYIYGHCFNWSTKYIMSITVSNCQHCDEQQFQTLSCVHYTIFSVVKLIDTINVTGSDSCPGKNYAYASRTYCFNKFSILGA